MLLKLTEQGMNQAMTALLASNISFGNTGVGNYTLTLGQNIVTPGSIEGFSNATFNGSTPITTSPGFADGYDPIQGEKVLTLSPPSGGFRWVANSSFTGSQTIRSVRVDNAILGIPLGTANLDTPIVVSSIGDQVVLGPIQISIFSN